MLGKDVKVGMYIENYEGRIVKVKVIKVIGNNIRIYGAWNFQDKKRVYYDSFTFDAEHPIERCGVSLCPALKGIVEVGE